jgi:signal transduction histidine kinase/signal recognition particle receptor subunit beta
VSIFERAQNLLHLRIVLWGPAGAGKTASLLALRRLVDPEDRLRVCSIADAHGRTLSFDVLHLEDFTFGTYRVRVRVVAVPGSMARGPMRAAALEGADAVVFVADSRRSAENPNLDSVRELASILRARGVDAFPIVWGLNRRDAADALTVGDLRALLGCGDRPVHETIATGGNGVLDCFGDSLRLALAVAAQEHGLAVPEAIKSKAEALLPQLSRGAAPRFERNTADERQITVGIPASEMSLNKQSIEAQFGLAEAHAQLDAAARILESRNRELMAINRVSRSILNTMDVENLLVVLLDGTADYLNSTHASCVIFDPGGSGRLRSHVQGFGRCPALGLDRPEAARFFELMQDSDGPVPVDNVHNRRLLDALKRCDRRIKRALFQSLRGRDDKPLGWIGIFVVDEEAPLPTTQQLLFVSSIGRFAALGIDKIAMLAQLKHRAAAAERELSEMTSEAEMTQARVRALNRGLESRVTERTEALEEANRSLRRARAVAVHQARIEAMAELSSSLSQQLGSPLTELGDGLQGLRAKLDDLRATLAAQPEAADGLKAIDAVEQEIERAAAHGARVHELVAGMASSADGEFRPVSLNTVAADALTALDDRIKACAELTLALGQVPDVEGDALALSEVVKALLTNAVEAIERGGARGALRVSSFATNGDVTLMLQDNGAGIEAEMLSRVFEPFVTSKSGEATAGVGLHLVYRSVKAHGGKIRLRSRPGLGTSVKVSFPAIKAAATPA